MRIYVSLECEGCDNTIYQLNFVLDEHRGVPIVPADVATHTRFDCDNCGTPNWTGDLSVLAEERPDEDDDE